MASTFILYSTALTIPLNLGGGCNRLPILCQDRHLEGSKTATLYIDLQINIACRSPFPFQLSITPSLLPSSCIYIEPPELHLQLSRSCNSSHCKAHIRRNCCLTGRSRIRTLVYCERLQSLIKYTNCVGQRHP